MPNSLLGELIGIATKENKGLSDSVQALNSTIYKISTGNKDDADVEKLEPGTNSGKRGYQSAFKRCKNQII